MRNQAQNFPPLIKICGLTRPEDVSFCNSLGVNFTGFIFVEKSRRFISPETAAAMPDGPAKRVGVFASAGLSAVLAALDKANLDFAQLHGGEDVEFCRAVGAGRVIKVLWPEGTDPKSLQEQIDRFTPVCNYFLFDAGAQLGGSGLTFNWSLLEKLTIGRPWFLAGGLGPQTLPLACSRCSPDGFDLNSALETQPGVKDQRKIAASVQIITRQP